MERKTLKYKGTSRRGVKDLLTDAFKVCLVLYFPFLFKIVDTEGGSNVYQY